MSSEVDMEDFFDFQCDDIVETWYELNAENGKLVFCEKTLGHITRITKGFVGRNLTTRDVDNLKSQGHKLVLI